MADVDPRSTASRALRASVGLSVLAAALLACGAVVEATGNLIGPSANGSGGNSHPATAVQPTHAPRRPSEAPLPHFLRPTSPAHLPRPTTTATAGGDAFTRW